MIELSFPMQKEKRCSMNLDKTNLNAHGSYADSDKNARRLARANGHPILRRVIERIVSERAEKSDTSFSSHNSHSSHVSSIK